MTNAETSSAATSRPSKRRICRRRRMWKKHVCIVLAMWADMLNSQSNCTPKSRIAALADTIVASPTTTSFSEDDSNCSPLDEPYHNRSVLPAFNYRPRQAKDRQSTACEAHPTPWHILSSQWQLSELERQIARVWCFMLFTDILHTIFKIVLFAMIYDYCTPGSCSLVRYRYY